MTIKVQLTYTITDTTSTHPDPPTVLATITGLCANRIDIPRLVEHMLASEAAHAVAKGGTFAETVVTLSPNQIAGARVMTRAPSADVRSIRSPARPHAGGRTEGMARRNGTYVMPKAHMSRDAVRAHDELLAYLNRMPDSIAGVDVVKAELHRLWWAWYDHKSPPTLFLLPYISKQAPTLRLWYAEWLMLRLNQLGFAGQRERLFVQHKRAAFVRRRVTLEDMDRALEKTFLVWQKLSSASAKTKD